MYRLAKPGEVSYVGFRQRLLDEFIAGRELAAALAPGATHLLIESHSEYDDEGGYYDSMDGVEFYRGIERLYPFTGDEPREELLAAWDRLMALYGYDDKLAGDEDPLDSINNFLEDNNIFSEAFLSMNGTRIDLERAPEKPKELYVFDQAA